MQHNASGSLGRTLFAACLLSVAGLLAAASAAQEPPLARPTPPRTYVPSSPTPPVVRLSQQFRYRGGHPIHPDFGQGWCSTPGSHTHPYPPFEPELFCAASGELVFIGDPADFQYEGDVYWYANPHPLDADHGGGWCYYPWPHRHTFAMSDLTFNLVGGILYFIGDFTQGFYSRFRHKRRFFRRHYRRRYLRGRVYKAHKPRYVRVGPGMYRLLSGRRRFLSYRSVLRRRRGRRHGLRPLLRRRGRRHGLRPLLRRRGRLGGLRRLPRRPGGRVLSDAARPGRSLRASVRRMRRRGWRSHRQAARGLWSGRRGSRRWRRGGRRRFSSGRRRGWSRSSRSSRSHRSSRSSGSHRSSRRH